MIDVKINLVKDIGVNGPTINFNIIYDVLYDITNSTSNDKGDIIMS